MAGAADDYERGDMDIAEQRRTFSGFMSATVWSSAWLVMTLLGATLIFAVGVSWPIAIAIAAVVGLIIGFFLNLGAGWIATVVATVIVAGLVGVVHGVVSALTG